MKPKTEDSKNEDLKEKIKIEDAKEKGESDQEMMNLENEIYSLTHYADDEEELVAQMFATIKGSKLEAMMPPILKEIPLIDVQQLCLHELRGMSQRRILSIINGQEMSGSSSEDSEDDSKRSKMQDENDGSNMAGKVVEDADDLLTGKDLNDLENVNESNLTALDILELEMRAKLIKTMLEKQDGDDDDDEVDKDDENTNGLFDPNIKIKEEPLTPDNKRMEDESPYSRHRSKYSRRRKGRRDSRSYSSSSRSSYSSRSMSYSRSGSSRSRSYSSDKKRDGSGSPESKKATKKKITKKEFEARMKKAKMNRSYRKRKESEEDSGGEKSKGKRKPKKKAESTDKEKEEKEGVVEAAEDADAGLPAEEKPSQQPEVEKGEDKLEVEKEEEEEEGEVEEKEEGEIDSNEEGAYSSDSRSSRSRSRSYSSYSSYSSRSSRSYSRSRRRRKSKKSKSKKKYRRSRSRSLSDVPKIPNWKPETSETKPDNSEEVSNSQTEPETTLPEERESISFSFNKKTAPIKNNSGLAENGVPSVKPAQDEDKTDETNLDTNDPAEADNSIQEEVSEPLSVESKLPLVNELSYTLPLKISKPTQQDVERSEFTEDFYKGADQLSFSEEEGECEDEAELDKFLHDDTPVEPLSVGDSILRKSVNVVSNKNEPPAASWESRKKKERKVDMAMEGVGFIKTALSESQSNVDFPMEEDISLPDVGEESPQDVLEPLPETEPEADDSMDSHNVEIIGVIDPTENQDEPFDEELAAGGSSWSMRWLQSEKVQKVVSNSTLLSKVRKKIQAKGKGKGKGIVKEIPKAVVPKQQVEVKPKPITPKIEIKPPQSAKTSNVIGSIEEYEKLVGIKVNAPTSLPQPKPQSKAVSQAVSILDSGDDEDSEEEAIWSKIMKK